MSENHPTNELVDQSNDVVMGHGLSRHAYDLITLARRAMVDHGVTVQLGEATLRFAVRGQEFSDGSDHELWFKALESGLFLRAESSRGSQRAIHWLHLGSSDDAHETLAPYVERMTAVEIDVVRTSIAADVALNIHRRAAAHRMRSRGLADDVAVSGTGAARDGGVDEEPVRVAMPVYRGG